MVKKRNQRRRNQARLGQGRVAMAKLPSPFNRLSDDSTTLKCRGVLDLTAGSVVTSGYMALQPGARVFSTLYNFVATLDAMAGLYKQFVVNRMTVKLIPTIPLTSGAMIAVGFEPTDNGESRVPDAYVDVLISKHHVTTNQTEERSFSFSPMAYTNDWKQTSSLAIPEDSSNGYLQWYSNYAGAGPGTVIGYLDVTFDITFAGLYRARAS